ncbi:hypothetical protein M758_UG083400 [Ceratodon purpureus]|nr:hypothetical protein M758_UG083400 [Ceratodon purpureus]
MAQFLISVNDAMPNAHKFIVYMLDDTHIYVQPDVSTMHSKKLKEFRDHNALVKPFEA